MAEGNYVLLLTVFEDRKGSLVQIGDDVLFVVDDGGVEENLVDIFAEDEDAVIVGIFLLVFFRRVWFWRVGFRGV
jgi:hypothetical protein